MSILLNQHRKDITQVIADIYTDSNPPRMGLNTVFFPKKILPAKQLSIDIERELPLISIDVQRNTEANLNTFDKNTEKIFVPPYFEDEFDFTAVDRYDATFGMGMTPSEQDSMMMIDQATKYLMKIKNKQMRAIEKMTSDVLNTGILTFNAQDSINFQRKAESMVQKTGGEQWNQTTADPFEDLRLGAEFIRNQGLSSSNIVRVIMGAIAFEDFQNNQRVKDTLDNRRIMDRAVLQMPEMNGTTGLTFQGRVAVGDYIFDLFTYNDIYYSNPTTPVKYVGDNKVYMMAEDMMAKTYYCSVPAIMRDRNNAEFPQFIGQAVTDFYVSNRIDERAKAHLFQCSTAPVPTLLSVDKIFTLTTRV